MEVNSPPPRAPRAKHQHSRSATNVSPLRGSNEHQPGHGNRRQRNNNSPHPHGQKPPAWDSANISDSAEGYFDAKGSFVSGSQHNSQHNSAVEDSPGPPRSKKNRQKKPKESEANGARNVSGQRHPSNQHVPPSNAQAASGTPAKAAYAGPTFHASPAASALPMPKFLSKSVPSATASTETSMQARLDQEPSSSDQSGEDSPALTDSKPSAPNGPVRQESPLDFFFKADREEKAKKASMNGPATPNGKAELATFQSAPPQANNWSSIYGSHERHHSRNASSGSVGREMFALELDGTSTQARYAAPNYPQELSNSVPAAVRQTQNDSLRSFLNSTVHNSSPSPKSFASPDRHVSGYSSDQQTGSPVYYRNHTQMRSSSGPSTPAPQGPHGQTNGSFHYGNRNLSPLFHAAKNDSSKRPSGSGLRREVSASPTTNGVIELPAPHNSNATMSLSPQGPFYPPAGMAPNYNGPVSQPPAPQRSKSTGVQSSSTNVQTMEDDLRRILKLTALGGNSGASGVQN